MYCILIYKTVDNYVEKRVPYREAHLAWASQWEKEGKLVLGGALTDPADMALLVFRGDTPAVAESFAMNDPYVKNGLVKEWEVREWNLVIGKL